MCGLALGTMYYVEAKIPMGRCTFGGVVGHGQTGLLSVFSMFFSRGQERCGLLLLVCFSKLLVVFMLKVLFWGHGPNKAFRSVKW